MSEAMTRREFVHAEIATPSSSFGGGSEMGGRVLVGYATRTGATTGVAEAIGETLAARGAHGSLGAFPGFFLSGLGTLVMTIAMVRGHVFGCATSWIGVAGAAAPSVYTVGIALAPGSTALMTGVAMPGGLLVMAWSVMVALRLLHLAKEPGTTE